ncbi:hypothetical protein [Rhodoblastus sp.]|uniref:hypothetical protein n=1 Tax=Rhodoblastus sp. TaxID=1962975 RepID=UPI0035AE4F6B
MRTKRVVAGVSPLALLLALAPARAETPPVPPVVAAPADSGESSNGRFVMTPVADGFLRLDTRTGQVSLCAISAGQAQCRASADERAALEAEIDRLAKENARLKAGAPAQAQSDAQAAPEEEERRFDRALDRAERFMRRMMQLFRESDNKAAPSTP